MTPRMMLPLLLGLLGCGDALVDETFRGAPLFTLRGNTNGATTRVDADQPDARIAVFWAPRGPRSTGIDDLVEQPATSKPVDIPFSYSINLFDPPGPEHSFVTPDGAARAAIGMAAVYADRDRDGRRDPDEPIVGVSAARALLYSALPLSAAQSPTGRALPAGYNQVLSPLPCMIRPPLPLPPSGSAACDVPLGQACASDADCGVGTCLKDFINPWPRGGCALPHPPPPGCPPPGSVRMEDQGRAFYLKGCTTNADCGRPYPYQCDQAQGACMPTQALIVELGDPPRVTPWCQ